MLKFMVLKNGRPAHNWPLRNAYLLGSDNNAVRADVVFRDGYICCDKTATGPAALMLQVPVGTCGQLSVQTCLLPERDEPYLLSLELARHQLRVLYTKLEDWSMFELDADHPMTKRAELARKLFIEALCRQNDDPVKADKLATDSLIAGLDGCEELALAHAEVWLTRRKAAGTMPRYPIGCSVRLGHNHDPIRAAVAANFDFVSLPLSWRNMAPEEGEYNWDLIDSWIDWLAKARMPVIVGPLISFEPAMVPDWLYIWEHDFDTVRDLVYEHVERVVSRYRKSVSAWNVVSGLHVNNHFTFNFDQIMDLTRMTTMLVKKIQPTAKALVELTQPFGEYYSTNQRSIPPLMYADLIIQGAVNFDGFSIKLLMGQAQSGQYARDLMQVSSLLDQFAGLGKQLTLSVAAPSGGKTDSGFWRKAWSPQVQSHWLEALLNIALSKPFVDSVAWHELVDHDEAELAHGGLVNAQFAPKVAFRRLVVFRKGLGGNGHGEAASQINAAAQSP